MKKFKHLSDDGSISEADLRGNEGADAQAALGADIRQLPTDMAWRLVRDG